MMTGTVDAALVYMHKLQEVGREVSHLGKVKL
jgi:hypothetical protein